MITGDTVTAERREGEDHATTLSARSVTSVMMHDPAPAPRTKKVLVVEDDVILRFVIAEVLRDGGLTVAEAGSGDEAIVFLRTGDQVDLVFSDIQMPGETDGLALAARIHDEFPRTQVLLTSGHVRVNEHIPFVRKPYVVTDVLATIRIMLEGSDGE